MVMSHLKPLSEIITNLLEREPHFGFRFQDTLKWRAVWSQVQLGGVESQCRPIGFRNGTLLLKVLNPRVAPMLHLQKREILNQLMQINVDWPEPLRDIKFCL